MGAIDFGVALAVKRPMARIFVVGTAAIAGLGGWAFDSACACDPVGRAVARSATRPPVTAKRIAHPIRALMRHLARSTRQTKSSRPSQPLMGWMFQSCSVSWCPSLRWGGSRGHTQYPISSVYVRLYRTVVRCDAPDGFER